jgi:hypothetical protein
MCLMSHGLQEPGIILRCLATNILLSDQTVSPSAAVHVDLSEMSMTIVRILLLILLSHGAACGRRGRPVADLWLQFSGLQPQALHLSAESTVQLRITARKAPFLPSPRCSKIFWAGPDPTCLEHCPRTHAHVLQLVCQLLMAAFNAHSKLELGTELFVSVACAILDNWRLAGGCLQT